MMLWLCPNNVSLCRFFTWSPWDACFISYNGKLGNISSLSVLFVFCLGLPWMTVGVLTFWF